MSIYELSLAMNGSGKAKRIWENLRSGIDPLDSTLSSLRGTRAIETLRKLNSEYSILDSSLLSTTLNHNDITISSCGTQKMLLSLKDGYKIESVLIPSYKFDRTTLCISTQIGCDRGCRFCATGKMGLIRNLQGHEIVSQVVQALKVVNEDPLMPPLLNVVFMGMGDAGQNIHEVSKAVEALTDNDRLKFAKSKCTLSTVGGSPSVFKELAECPGSLAWSLHSAVDEKRRRLVPSTRHTVVELREGLIEALKGRESLKSRTMMIACTLIAGINDGEDDAKALADFVQPIIEVAGKVALDIIPYNDIDREGDGLVAGDLGGEYRSPTEEAVKRFTDVLKERGCYVCVRVARGDNENSACGMLATERKKKRI
ncbi:hypothetical protein TrLO_g8188 [Triparma laevis f. longispina]|uniref:Radical SAM core domain-containing protein n=1 Tax=Triparma laevis f. longispina TaxID=1714387 RepID=A0A9W6Z8A7_9STRA|nr:hypothetical protein TrLO_g8188 [Triparma laevis f. longispina]